jgi:uncharacterized repeat protein (TIGR01451 family)
MGVGGSINNMNTHWFMITRLFLVVRSSFVMGLILLLLAASVPTLTMATGTTNLPVPSLPPVPDLVVPPLPPVPDLTVPSLPSTDHQSTVTSCRLFAITNTAVTSGGSVTLGWEVQGFSTVTINGESVSATGGTRTFTNITENTTYTLRATTADGKSSCTATVQVTCLPPVTPKECDLTLTKAVDKTTAKPGDTVTYTITVKNTGTGDCTGTGVKIYDVVDPNITYQSHTVSNNLSAGYGSSPVYTPADRTLRFNGHDLTPGETGTITWVGKIATPTTCGDFEVKNQAKATAKELDNFTQWKESNRVVTAVDFDCPQPPVVPPTCVLSPVTQTLETGATTTLTWSTTNANDVQLSSFGAVATSGSRVTPALSTTTTYVLTARNSATQQEVTCRSVITVTPPPVVPVPQCVSFTASPLSINRGASSTLTWNTVRGTRVVINNGIGEVAATGSVSVSPLDNTTYILTVFGTEQQTPVNCQTAVTVTVPPPTPTSPRCELFTATPSQVPYGGGTTTLAWAVRDASAVSISNGVGTVGLTGNREVFVGQNTTFILTATDADETVTCNAPVTVAPPPPPSDPFTCANAVSFTASPSAIRRGQSTTLTWSTTNVTSLSISGGVSNTALSGSATVSPSDSTTYILTANRGTQSIQCPVRVSVSSGGGGGGGSSSPRCELTISERVIDRGDEVTLRWESTRASDLELTDSEGDILVTTKDKLSADKTGYFNGSRRVRPEENTTYTLVVERGTREEICEVDVRVRGGGVIVLESRDQQPLVAGIALTSVPYTGFEAGPIVTFMFYLLLGAWAALIAYLLVIRRDRLAGYQFVTPESASVPVALSSAPEHIDERTPVIPGGLFVERVQPPVIPPLSHLKETPENLPTGRPVVGYDAYVSASTASAVAPTAHFSHQADDAAVTALEDHAHAKKALLSSDAIRFFISTTNDAATRLSLLDTIIADAKAQYPLEDGWVVINEARMRNLCAHCKTTPVASAVAPHIPATIPDGSGSLAEAIVTGNVVAAYQMIGHRPMFALADAASDLDSVVRLRKGETVIVSDLLQTETQKLSDAQLQEMIVALTGALDGTYTDEASAVKMAIMKAVKVVA